MFKSKSKINFESFKSIPISYKIIGVVCSVVVASFSVYLFVLAGTITSPGDPASAGRMYTLEQIYQKFYTGTTATKQSGGFTEPGLAPGSTMHTLDNIYGDFTTDITATSGTVAANVLSGKTFFATSGTTRGASWGPVAGAIPDKTGLNVASTAQSQASGVNYFTATQGYYDGTAKVSATDAQVAALASDLATGNVKNGATIFGVNGSTKVLDTTSGTATNGQVLLNQVCYSNGSTITGNITNGSDVTVTSASTTIPAGYYSGSQKCSSTAGSAVTVTDSSGTAIPAGYYSGTPKCSAALTGGTGSAAAAGQILNGYYAYGSNGANVNGTFKALLPTTFQAACYDTDGPSTITCGGTDWPAQDADTIGNSGACTPTYTQGDYTVKDECTNLEWQRYGHGSNNGYTAPASISDCYDADPNTAYASGYCTYTWQYALKYCANLNNAQMGSGWRLPNPKELQSIVDYSIHSPSINEKFTNTKLDDYWSSTTSAASGPAYAWVVDFYDGFVDVDGKTVSYCIRCVRQY